MTKLYAIHGGSSIFALVRAKTRDEAFDVFAKNQIINNSFREEIDSLSINGSLLDKFYRDDSGYFISDFGGYPERLLKMDEEDREKYIDFHIEKNIKKFWGEFPQHAEAYLKELKAISKNEDIGEPSFSEDFYVQTIKLIIADGEWYDSFDIVEVEIPETKFQVIYQDS
ncbi:hypothetical protein [uncultured Exiguobacterium sp.]|uniref:hypothetical protein n=1 Tax=uncultured Exiguobacterium sp. TaxID=202669 RepID=UPI0025E16DA4|nr:hypothetical protein [uncultured Exiguobacterium sp.]